MELAIQIQIEELPEGVFLATSSAPEVPILHLGEMGPLHRRDIYDDARRLSGRE
jgi:hypothetical protein